MFGIGTSELMIILAVGLIVIGPQKLPDLAKAIGRAVGEFRKATSEIKETLEGDENLASVKQTFEDAMQEGMNSGLVQETLEEVAQSTALDNMEDSYGSYGAEEEPEGETPDQAPGQAGTEEMEDAAQAELEDSDTEPEPEEKTSADPPPDPHQEAEKEPEATAGLETDNNTHPVETHEPDKKTTS